MANTDHFGRLRFQLGHTFTPRTPINERDLFAGRVGQLATIIQAVSQRGCHAVLYGERGVGKTSLANIMTLTLPDIADNAIVTHTNCVASDDYVSIWRKALGEISTSAMKQGIGFRPVTIAERSTLAEMLPEKPQPHHVKNILDRLNGHLLVVFAITVALYSVRALRQVYDLARRQTAGRADI